jgi:hypothetical protein
LPEDTIELSRAAAIVDNRERVDLEACEMDAVRMLVELDVRYRSKTTDQVDSAGLACISFYSVALIDGHKAPCVNASDGPHYNPVGFIVSASLRAYLGESTVAPTLGAR